VNSDRWFRAGGNNKRDEHCCIVYISRQSETNWMRDDAGIKPCLLNGTVKSVNGREDERRTFDGGRMRLRVGRKHFMYEYERIYKRRSF